MQGHTVAALATADANIFELAVAVEVFGLDRPELGVDWYDFVVCCDHPGRPRTTRWGVTMHSDHGLDELAGADTVVIPAGSVACAPPPEVLDAVQRAYRRGARIVSFCSGAFTLGHAGVLDGRRATTHWMFAERFAALFPDVEMTPDVLYVEDHPVYTSAGTAAGIDLALHLVRLDHGVEVATGVARRMVVPPHRDGGQAQYVAAPVPEPATDDPIAATLDWAIAHLDQPLSVEDLARHALVSPRTLARRFVDVVGTTPHQWLLGQRVALARRLLESGDDPVDIVAVSCGFGSAAVLRTHFARHVGTSPSAYRATFRGPARSAG